MDAILAILVASRVPLNFYGASQVLRDAALVYCDAARWIYHVPRDIAIIIVRYHTEVDKLVVWS